MKNIVIGLAVVLSLSGCVTRKIPVKQEAKEVTPITEISAIQLKCELIEVYTLEDSHPNNVVPILKNQTYLSGGNRYRISDVLKTRKGRPSSVMAELYKCGTPYTMKPAGNVQLLPGAYSVKPIAFSEIENNDCKILTTHVVEKTSPDSLEIELANEAYMLGGNRFHITKIIDSDGVNPTSVVADIYRCKHRTVAFN
ncbi:DUF1471 domain-containing protein [Photobacterium chitinilyticum]|uniref:DUF1471 domain-containing protein n=1 Tax=Photobacterium chitinilyticum TaxID=2485123 RepID=A0A3S3RBZ0_9GAMM|nr:DUF1471 domain-containing protein [Photobacterium chitinilyticum]RWX57390.1 DUF1471 domain-containing protein [Photobacterium chitinilyticum]